MTDNIFAYTGFDPEQPQYPGYVSINRLENGDVCVIVRGEPIVENGIVRCGSTVSYTVPSAMWTL
jgi:hypothetical protein